MHDLRKEIMIGAAALAMLVASTARSFAYGGDVSWNWNYPNISHINHQIHSQIKSELHEELREIKTLKQNIRHEINLGGFNHEKNKVKIHTSLSGHEEVPGPGDPDGWGHAKVVLNLDNNEVCTWLNVKNIESATAAHIHEASFGQAGPVVVTLPTPNASGNANGCVSVSADLIHDIHHNPSNFYVNVHNSPYPSGAIRGQL